MWLHVGRDSHTAHNHSHMWHGGWHPSRCERPWCRPGRTQKVQGRAMEYVSMGSAEEEDRDVIACGARLTYCTQPFTHVAQQLASKQVQAALVQARRHAAGAREGYGVRVCALCRGGGKRCDCMWGETHSLHTTIHTRGTAVGIQAGASGPGAGQTAGSRGKGWLWSACLCALYRGFACMHDCRRLPDILL